MVLRLDDDNETIALEKAELALADARRKVQRYERLASASAISEVERENAQSELSSAILAEREAKIALDYRTIRAPFAGVMGISNVEAGDLITSSTEIASIDDRSRLKVEFRIPEKYAAMVAIGDEAIATTPSRPGETFTGSVSALGSRIETDSRTLVVRAEIDNADDQLRPGMSFLVELRFPGEKLVAVPALSVQWDKEGTYVWRVTDGKAERVPVQIVERNNTTTLVTGGVRVGDTVVQEGVQRLRAGGAVADVTADAADAAPDSTARSQPSG
ncbi:efflux RND transporter periplasmic adaptor subunit [Methylobrevis pamukkalensis]|uniref:Multidrug resistance protein MdtA n=1 Tax=Methylobrevis pamukkalensis TaxID=1439726 RepID=A0A1E3H6I5_9HYPH|nr:efflux RND transporter periplasmic adaptor subunit [Methylobrevis pamukkalensis]ODN71924.1 Multidrug resistance protein MdtA precursor [Methylobrevis pamukkalensis]